jgi:hypothetical protein
MPSRADKGEGHGMRSSHTHSTRPHLTRTTPAADPEHEAVRVAHDGHAAARLRHLHGEFGQSDRFRPAAP